MELHIITLIPLYLLTLASAAHTNGPQAKCNYKTEVLVSGLDRPYQLSIYKREHKIFFSYNVGNDTEDTFEIAYIEKGKNYSTVIRDVKNGFASAVDEENHIVYLGGSTGIFKYYLNKKEHHVEKIISKHNIWHMFFKEYLYFIDYPSQKLYRYNTSETGASPVHQQHITEKIYQFVIDKENDQFITTDNGVYSLKPGSNERTHYSHIKQLRGVALNNEGRAHFCGNHSIYVTNKRAHSLDEIVSLWNIFGLTFDREDNIIYSDPRSIVKLTRDSC